MLCFVVQIAELYLGKVRCLAGTFFTVVSLRGTSFAILLSKSGQALLFNTADDEVIDRDVVCRGRWLQFPEGTIIQWSRTNIRTDGISDLNGAGDFGLITYGDGHLVYEGYQGSIFGQAKSVAHLDRRALPDFAASIA
jgi:hypothetical protein